ncbi:hypothetical protein [Nonomuraea dietziae]|uniref:hypothetical protein n=1 Tax=Nonomuraea dietziae TaxID=65515 RepID=UPI0031DD2C44
MTELAVIGTGGLARAVCYALAVTGPSARITVIGRDPARTAELCHVGMARAAHRRSNVTFRPVTGSLPEALASAAPAGVLLAASSQSPWESLSSPSAGPPCSARRLRTHLPSSRVRRPRGHGTRLGQPWVLVRQRLLPRRGQPRAGRARRPVLCGIGNAGLLAASIQTALGLADQRELQVLAHHVHLYTPSSPRTRRRSGTRAARSPTSAHSLPPSGPPRAPSSTTSPA